jgi:hypothetical protein
MGHGNKNRLLEFIFKGQPVPWDRIIGGTGLMGENEE